MAREQWGSKLGFVLAAAGSAVGLGNIWKFPYVTGRGGGAAFVVLYLILVAVVGATLMSTEMALGRLSQRNCLGTFRNLGGGAWSLLGISCILCPTIIVSYYVIIGGWTVKYFFHSFTGLMPAALAGQAGGIFDAFVSNPVVIVAFTALYVFLTTYVVYRGVGGGIERSSKVMMPALFLLLIVLAVRSILLPGSSEGLSFFLKPDFSKLNGEIFLSALGQAFFSLSLGMGIMITYGSYIRKEENIPRCTAQVCVMDSFVAIMAGLIVFPAASAFGVDVGQGPGLAFVTLPNVFAHMPASFLWSALFFLLMFVAALTSSVSLLEVPVSWLVDRGMDRKKAALVAGLFIFVLAVPSALSLQSGVLVFGGKSFFDVMGFVTDNLLMPLNAVLICVFAGWVMKQRMVEEITNGGTLSFKLRRVWWFCLRFVAPILILWIFIAGLKW